MSTVKSLETYHLIRGIAEQVSFAQSGGNDWDLVIDSVGPKIAAEYSSAFIWTDDAEVKQIWGCEQYTPWLAAYCELIYSNSRTWLKAHSAELKESFKPELHWIAQSGMHGYLPESSEVYDSEEDAVDDLTDSFELSDEAAAELRDSGMVDIDETNSNIGVSAEHSIWYVSVESCNCSNPNQHSDTF